MPVSAASPAPAPLVSRVRKLSLRDKMAMLVTAMACTFLAYLSMEANDEVGQAILDSRVCVPRGQHSPDGSLRFASILAGGAMVCAALASLQGSRILFSADENDRTRTHLGRLLLLLTMGGLCAGLAYDRTTSALEQRDIKRIMQGVVSLSSSPEARAVQYTSWMVLASVFGMGAVIRMMYSRGDKPGAAFAAVGHAATDKIASSVNFKLKNFKDANNARKPKLA